MSRDVKFATGGRMALSKVIPQHVHSVSFNWCVRDFMLMSPEYRAARTRMNKPMDACFWCHHKFVDGEMMALAQPATGGNKVLCQTCAEMLIGPKAGPPQRAVNGEGTPDA
jgi:hypothetical protein